jgi:hypothetical protein
MTELEKLVGRTGTLDIPGGMRVQVKILEVKQTYGRLRVRVRPVAGDGEAWIYRERVTLTP